MAHIERRPERPSRPWRARYRGPDGKERSRSFARKTDAQRWLAEMEVARSAGTWVDPVSGRTRFEQWADRWKRTTTNLRPTTVARDAAILRCHVLPRFGPMALAAIGQIDVRVWVADLVAQGLAPASVQKAYQVLSKIMAAAVDARMIPESPCRRVPLPKIERNEMRFLTAKEVRRLADAIVPSYRALVLLGAYGGLRIGEMAGLRRSRVDHDGGVVHIVEVVTEPEGRLHVGPTKTRAGHRSIGLPRFVVTELARLLA